jgi:hypothetical protein
MKLDSATLRTIEKLLADEISLCDDYLKVLDSEQHSVIKLKADAVGELTLKRQELCEKLEAARAKRTDLTLKLGDGKTLTEIVSASAPAAEKKRILQLIDKLKARARQVDGKSKEFTQVVNFSLGLVNGSLSILWSATQSVTKCYNAFGAITEMVQPVAPRMGSLLGKA